MKEKEKPTKSKLIEAFDESDSKTVADLCRIAKVSRYAFYYNFNRDQNFRREYLTKQQAHLAQKITAA